MYFFTHHHQRAFQSELSLSRNTRFGSEPWRSFLKSSNTHRQDSHRRRKRGILLFYIIITKRSGEREGKREFESSTARARATEKKIVSHVIWFFLLFLVFSLLSREKNKATRVFSPKNLHLCRKKMVLGQNTRTKRTKTLDTQCTPLCLVFPPGALPGGHTHRSSGIPCGA